MQPILKSGRILRPAEYEQLRDVLKSDNQAQLDGLLLTGMRYVEAERFQADPSWLDKQFVNLPIGASLKKKATFKDRTIRLSNTGALLVPQFLKVKPLPLRQSWDRDLKRWAVKAGLDPVALCAKTTRKTYESWLVFCYPDRVPNIAASQGHTTLTQFKHYLNMPFTDEDKKGMLKWVDGWI